MNVSLVQPIIRNFFVLLIALVFGACQSLKDPQTALEEANLEKAIYCMDLLENKKDLDAARRECFGETYIQHTPAYPDGSEAVLSLFARRFETYPDFEISIKRAAADGDLVWIHLHAKSTPDALGSAVINIFRMKAGKFVEHWNVVQAVPAESANANTMF